MKNKMDKTKITYCERLGASNSEPLKDSEQVAELLYQNWDKETIGIQETFKVLLLDTSNKVKGTYQVSPNGVMGTMVIDVKLLFAVALKIMAKGLILAQNHPSGNPRPSAHDEKLTKKIQKAGKLFDIQVLDHLIILPDGKYFSFMDNRLL